MTFVVELRDLKKRLHRPVTHFWRRNTEALYLLRIRLAFVALLGLALDGSIETRGTPGGGVFALLCGVLTAAVSATIGLFFDASIGLYALFNGDATPVLRAGQRLSLYLGEPLLPFDTCSEGGSFPAFSGYRGFALAICAFFLFGWGYRRQQRSISGGG